MFLSMYPDCTNTINPHIIIIIFCIFWLYFMFFLTNVFVFPVFDSHH
jgi:hypothetical protein